ncbi:harmonin-binding protein USHBP1 [Elgaria multicarinata webbii]|uniref:harmonin-binding protein USHBP1 n=1 Tax=Elgaria multicarinata webbii TaxID=159646 RepID=UPI002FCD5D68
MEKGEAEPVDGGFQVNASDEQAVLRYEEHITGLLVTVAQLHGKIEHLQDQKARDDEEFSDLCSEYTASLPRCPPQFSKLATMTLLPPLPPVHSEEGRADLFLDVHKAVTSLENTVFSHRSRIPSTEAEVAGYVPATEGPEKSLWTFQRCGTEPSPTPGQASDVMGLGFLTDEMSVYEREIALQKERNAALLVELGGRDEVLSRSQVMLCAYQEERDKLQRKVRELQDALSKMETLADADASPVGEREPWGFQDPVAAAQNVARCFRSTLSGHPACFFHPQHGPPPAETRAKDMEAQSQQLRGFIEKLRSINQLLSATLQESKSDTERISILLGRRESDNTALRLAVQYSERCLEAYEVLFSLTTARLHPSTEAADEEGNGTHTGESSDSHRKMKLAAVDQAYRSSQDHGADGEVQSSPEPWGLEDDKRTVLREHIGRLRAEQASVKLPAQRPPAGPDSVAARINAGIGAKVAEVHRALRDNLPAEAARPKMEKAHLLRELQAAREALADLNTRLHLTEKEKQGLELWTYTYRAQEAVCLLTIRILQGERDELRGQKAPSSESSSSSSDSSSGEYAPIRHSKRATLGSSEDVGGRRPTADPEVQRHELLDTLARNKELKDRIRSLLVDLEERSQDSRAQEAQQGELTRDFFKAHSALVLAYRSARKKQEMQLQQLQTQMGLMHQRQAGQLRSLMQTLQRLEGRASGEA